MNYISTADIIEASEDGITSNLLNSNFEIKLTGIVTEINTNKGYIKIRQDNEEKYYNFRFEERTKQDINSSNTLFLDKQNDKYGYVDKNGKVVVDYQYDDATEQNEYGYAAVQKDQKPTRFDARIPDKELHRKSMGAKFAGSRMVGQYGNRHRLVPVLHCFVDRAYSTFVEVLYRQEFQIDIPFVSRLITSLDLKINEIHQVFYECFQSGSYFILIICIIQSGSSLYCNTA